MSDYSRWAPKPLIEFYEALMDGSEAGEAETLPLQHPNTEVFGKLILNDSKNPQVGVDQEILWRGLGRQKNPPYRVFVSYVSLYSKGVPAPSKFTRKELDRVRAEVNKLTTSLQANLNKLDVRWTLADLVTFDENLDDGFSAREFGVLNRIELTQLIGLMNTALEYKAVQSQALSKPNDSHANIRYFVRKLHRHFKEQYDRPMVPVLAATARLVLDAPQIDEEYVKKATR